MSEATPPEYKPYDEREADSQYQDFLEKIYRTGITVHPIQGGEAKMVVGGQLHYPIENGFPIISDRDLSGFMMRGALAEHIAFLNGAQTLDDLDSFGVPRVFWERWLTAEKCAIFGLEPGDMGPGAYGAAWTRFPTVEGEPFNQIENVLRQMKERPHLRTHKITSWIPQYTLQHDELTRQVVVAPCHGDIHIMMFPETKQLAIHHVQRSGDFPVGVPLNMIQYASFGLMAAQHVGYTLREVVYTFSDVHIYESQYADVEELLGRTPRRLGSVALATVKDDIRDYRPDDFVLTDYDPHPKMRIPTPT